VGMTLTAHGMVEANPLDVMEYRSKINAWDVKVIAEVDSIERNTGNGKLEKLPRPAAIAVYR